MAIDKFLTSRQVLFFSFLASTIVGCFIAWFTPPFANPDEGAHYLRAYEVSRGHWVNRRGDVGVDILCSDYLIVAKKYAPVAYYQIEAEAMKPDAKSCHVSTVNTAGNYSPVPYLAAAIGIKIGKFFGAEVENRLRIGRLFNMILTSFICLPAIMWLPNVGVVLAFFALIPASFFLRASLSADALTLSFCLIYVGYIIFLLQKNANVNALIILKLSFLAVLLGSMKPVYGILVLITFLLFRPSDHFWHSFKNFSVLTVPSLSALLAGSLWILLADPELVYINKFGGANPVLQTKWIVEHPFTFLSTILQTFKLQSYDFFSQSVWPTLAAQQPVTVAIRNSIIGIFCFILFALILSNFVRLKLWQRATMLCVAVVCALVVVVPLYITFTLVGHNEVLGLQGRYFLPVLILCGFAFSFDKISFILAPTVRVFLGVIIPTLVASVIAVLYMP